MNSDPAQTSAAPRKRRREGVIGGGLWTVLERVLSQVAQLVIFVIAARVMSPAEFGVFTLVSTCAILMLRFSEASWQPYIMTWTGDATVPRQVVMISIWSGLALGIVGALAGTALVAFGVSAEIGHLIMLFSIWVVIATVSSAQKGMMIWQGRLSASALSEIVGDTVGVVVAVTALLHGWGIFALAFGRIAFQSTHLVLSFCFTRLAPLPGLRGPQLAALLAYTRQSFTSRMIANLRLYIATFLIGGFLGPAAVGYYRAAQRLVSAIGEIVGQPAQILAWNMFRRARDQQPGLSGFQAQARLYFAGMLAAGAPVFIWLALMGEDLIRGLMGEKWLPALPVVAVLTLSRVFATPSVATEPVLSLAGEIRRLPRFSVIFLVLTVAVTLAAAPYGLMAVAWAQVLVSVVVLMLMARLLSTYGGIDWADVMAACWRLVAPILLGTAALVWLRTAPGIVTLPPLLKAIAVIVPALPLYALAVVLAEPRLRARAWGWLRRLPASA
ncbi:oligosaccharide flippase family protein [Acidimangrovimonas sediminis]|uniref:oligosaccharide flippase family protein n=1 Tax=Acidimangrovimonas sediminis TaxID=2056283 RepID=UPI001304AF26|nr:oligosaccharide flippase family protein [Acidimangrovimonas sediminis]